MAQPSKKPTTSKGNKAKDLDLSDLYNNADPAEAMAFMPVGEFECELTDSAVEKDGKKVSVYLQWTGTEGEAEGKSGRMYYALVDDKGSPAKGMGFLKRDLATLEVEDCEGDFEEYIEDLKSKGLTGIIKVKQNGEYTNLYLQGAAMPKAPKPDEDEDEDEEVEVGDKVEGESVKGDSVTGEITRIKGDFIFVTDDDDVVHKCEASEVNKVTEKPKKKGKPASKADPEVGDEVEWDDDGEDKTGTINKIRGTLAFVEDDDGEIHKVELDDLTVI